MVRHGSLSSNKWSATGLCLSVPEIVGAGSAIGRLATPPSRDERAVQMCQLSSRLFRRLGIPLCRLFFLADLGLDSDY